MGAAHFVPNQGKDARSVPRTNGRDAEENYLDYSSWFNGWALLNPTISLPFESIALAIKKCCVDTRHKKISRGKSYRS